jgi:hypothetical protein
MVPRQALREIAFSCKSEYLLLSPAASFKEGNEVI